MSGPILPISNPSRDSINASLRLSSSSAPSSSSIHHPTHPPPPTPLRNPQTQDSLNTVTQENIESSPSSPPRSSASIRSRLSAMASAPAKGGQKEGSEDEARQKVEPVQAGAADKPVNIAPTFAQQQEEGAADKPVNIAPTFAQQQEEDERTGYARLIGTSFDETGKLWPEIRKLKLLTLRTAEKLGVFKDLSKSDHQYQYSILAGSYLRFVKSLFSSQHRCLWPVFAQTQFADHVVDVAILDLDTVQGQVKPKPMQLIHDYEELRSALRSRPSMSRTRFVLAEDLSPAMIEALGSELDLDPEFFADHIAGAEDNYVKSKGAVLDDGRLDLHPTAFLHQNEYFSVTWKRKGLQDLQNQATLREALVVLNMKEGINKSEQFGQIFNTNFTPNSNIWRGQDIMGVEYLPGVAVAAEERASVYFKTDPENEDELTVIILFDPVRKYKTDLTDDRTVNESALSYLTSRVTDPRTSYQTFHKEQRTYISTSSDWPTRVDFLSYLCLSLQPGSNSMVISPECPNTGFHRVSVLLHYALTDWQGVFQGLDGVLDKIDLEMSINAVLQERIYGWRHILGAWRKQLVNDKDKIIAAIRVIEEFGGNGCTCSSIARSKRNHSIPYDVDLLTKSYKELSTRVTNLIERTERTFTAIMSSMSILESQRAISQAESVNRVTELAFIFIPLSFAASLFGMDIQGWSENFTPELWFTISGGLVGGAYLFRLLVRARVISAATEELSTSIRRFGNIDDGGPVPTTTFIRWLLWKWGFAVLGLGAVAASITCIWKFVGSFAAKVAASVILSLVAFSWCMVLYLRRSWDVLFREYTQWDKTQPRSAIEEKEEGKFLSKTSEAKLRVWRDLSWKDILFPGGRQSTIRNMDDIR